MRQESVPPDSVGQERGRHQEEEDAKEPFHDDGDASSDERWIRDIISVAFINRRLLTFTVEITDKSLQFEPITLAFRAHNEMHASYVVVYYLRSLTNVQSLYIRTYECISCTVVHREYFRM